MLEIGEIIEIVKQKYNHDITVRMFNYYRDEGFFRVQGRRNRKGLYANDVPEIIAYIKKMQKEGMNLAKIKKSLQAQTDKKEIQEEIAQLKYAYDYLKGWDVPSERCRRLVSFLGLKESEYKFDVGMIGTLDGKKVTFLSVFSGETVEIYKFAIDFDTNKIEISEKKSLTLDGLEIIIRQMIRPNLDIGQILDKDDILLSIFYQ